MGDLHFTLTIRTSWITLHHFIFWESIVVIITPPFAPNKFWELMKHNSQEKSTPPITPKYSQIINWRNKDHLCFRTRSPTKRDRNLQFRGVVSTGFFSIFSSGIFPFSPGLLCNLVRKRPQNVEKIARLPGGEKSAQSCHVSGCHGFFGPDCYTRKLSGN